RGCRSPGDRRRRPTATPEDGSTGRAASIGWTSSRTWLARRAPEPGAGPSLRSRVVDPVEEALDDKARPPGHSPVLLTQGHSAGAEASRQPGELVCLGGQGIAGLAAYQVQPVAGALAESVRHGQDRGVGGVEDAGFCEG